MWSTSEIYHECELKWGVELVLDKANPRIQILSYAHLPLILYNTSSSLIAMEPQRKLNFWTIDFKRQML
jgi:hypothetical protein